jgi:hypothetical protein
MGWTITPRLGRIFLYWVYLFLVVLVVLEQSLVAILQTLYAGLCIDLCGLQLAMAQELLYLVNGHSLVQQKRSDALSQKVGIHFPRYTCLLSQLLNDLLNPPVAEPVIQTRFEQITCSSLTQMDPEFIPQERKDRHISLLRSFAPFDVDL